MKNKKLIINSILVGCILILIIFTPRSVYSEEAENPCILGELYLQAGKLTEAEGVFAGLLENNPQLACAISGLESIARQRKQLLENYISAGDYEKASDLFDLMLAQPVVDDAIIAQYQTMLTAVALTPTPEETPTPIPTATPNSYAKAEALLQLGRPDLAYAQLETAVMDNPEFFLIAKTPSLDASTLESKNTLFARSEEYKAKFLQLIELAGLFIICLIISIYLWRLIRSLLRCSFDIGEFKEGSGVECKPKDSFQSMVEREIWRLTERNGLNNRNIVYQPLDDITINESTLFKVNEVGQIIKVINQLFPPNLITLTGMLHYSEKKGAGVTLQLLKRKDQIIDEATLWQIGYDSEFSTSQNATSECFYKLAEPSALWLAWHLQTNFKSQCDCGIIRFFKRLLGSEKNNRLNLIKSYGTDNLNSYIFNYVASKHMEKGLTLKEAMSDLLLSYSYDPNNRLALFNLANQKIALISEDLANGKNQTNKKETEIDYKAPEKLLEKIERLSKNVMPSNRDQDSDATVQEISLGKGGRKEVIDSIRVLAKYHLGAIYGYLYVLKGFPNGKNVDFEKYKKTYKECEQILEKLREIERKKHKTLINNDLKEMIQAAIDGMYDLSELVKSKGKAEKLIDINDKYELISASLAYNLACNESHMAGYLNSLDKKPEEKIKEHIAKAEQYLSIAIKDHPEFEIWSKSDPDLKPLWDLTSKPTPPAIPSKYKYPRSLEDIFGISPVYVAKLKAISGMLNSDDLLKAGAEESGRVYIHRRTKLPLDLIEEWVKLADLMRVEWIDGSHAKLLLASGVDSVIKLKRQDVKKLLSLIGKTNKEYAFSNQLPSVNELKEWIASAQKLEILFEEN